MIDGFRYSLFQCRNCFLRRVPFEETTSQRGNEHRNPPVTADHCDTLWWRVTCRPYRLMKAISQQTKRRALQLKGYATYKGYALHYYIVFITTNNSHLFYDVEGYCVHKTKKKNYFRVLVSIGGFEKRVPGLYHQVIICNLTAMFLYFRIKALNLKHLLNYSSCKSLTLAYWLSSYSLRLTYVCKGKWTCKYVRWNCVTTCAFSCRGTKTVLLIIYIDILS